jgi:ABC-type transport system substrate-binding protein
VGLTRAPTARRAFLTTALALCAGLASGCTTINLTAPVVATQPTVPGGYRLDTAGTVTVGVSSLPTNFNPSTPAGDNPVTAMVMQQVLPQPFVTDSTFNVETSALLVSAEVQGIFPFTVLYVINPRAVWSDGVPITASDFIYAWHEHLSASSDLPNSGLVAGYRDIVSVAGSTTGRTVTVTFRKPFSDWQSLFSDLVPAHIGELYGWSAGFAGYSPTRILSGGPFEITSYDPGRSLTLSRNPRYWATPAHVERIRFVVERDAQSVEAALESGAISIGELDASEYPPGTLGNGLVTAPTLDTGGSKRSWRTRSSVDNSLAWSGYAGDEIWQLCFNLEDGLIDELAIRQAIEHAIDRDEIVADTEDLLYPPVDPELSRFTLGGEGANPSSPGTTPLKERVPALYSPAAAISLLRQAGYTPGADGLMRLGKTSPPLRLTLLEPSRYWAIDQAGLVIQAELRAIGVVVEIDEEPLDTMLSSTLPQGDYQMALAPFAISTSIAAVAPEYTDSVLPHAPLPGTGLSGGTSGLTGMTEPWSTAVPVGTDPGAVAAGGVTRDVMGVSDPYVAAALGAELSQLDPPSALRDLQLADNQMWSDAYSVPLFQPEYYLVHSRRVDNVSESPTWAGVMWDAQDWAIVKQAPVTTTTTTVAGATGAAG